MGKSFISIREKVRIVQESRDTDNIKATARKYGCSPSQIRQWKKTVVSLC